MAAPEEFFDAYVGAALWSSTGDDARPLDENHDASDIAPDTLTKMRADCDAFYAATEDTLADCEDFAQAGHDFWLTRCGHGAGFWDGDWPDKQGAKLTKAAKRFGNVDLYIGDDGLIHA